eukprot:CAMPEP_0174702104 /NCGR_PEP_ID=MMETSP1094-20130205/6507_1 /TAXON_ID=156173 /ORGANISM="Chrysochromulina brevifilum, Strain UTEX LB 985" /LENGTH=131 /DNA_ID=CAMNT_0015899839 /DNA_START=108 /DNA_END=500 /DNA_ORIENTATION=+
MISLQLPVHRQQGKTSGCRLCHSDIGQEVQLLAASALSVSFRSLPLPLLAPLHPVTLAIPDAPHAALVVVRLGLWLHMLPRKLKRRRVLDVVYEDGRVGGWSIGGPAPPLALSFHVARDVVHQWANVHIPH